MAHTARTKWVAEGKGRAEGALPVDVELSVVGQVVVDDQGHLRDVQAPGPDVGGDEHPAAARGRREAGSQSRGLKAGASHPHPGPWSTRGEGQRHDDPSQGPWVGVVTRGV